MAVVLNFFVLVCLAVSLGLWIEILRRWRAGESCIPAEPRAPVPWGPLEIVLAVGIYFLAAQAIVARGGPQPDPPAAPAQQQPPEILAVAQDAVDDDEAPVEKPTDREEKLPPRANAAATGIEFLARQILFQLVTVLGCLAFLIVGTRADRFDLGLPLRHVGRDARLGVVAFVAAAPPTFLLQTLLVQWYPSQHPIVDTLGKNPGPALLAVATILAVIVAPWCEEFFFRVLLQGWLEGADARLRGAPPVADDPPTAPPVWPLFASSAVFAALHAGHGPDPIPLFFLALVLGYLYRQTHRLWPSFVMHACFNATSMIAFALSLGEGS
ncbi:MAG: CPBP family intramembrane metalloprotease [Planctomycetaceae bacterium]|nr:CPBP family intramembrane metalloprotease [Planctomycetaceae bacterium]